MKDQLALYQQIQAIDAKIIAAREYAATQLSAKEYQAQTQTLELLKQTYFLYSRGRRGRPTAWSSLSSSGGLMP